MSATLDTVEDLEQATIPANASVSHAGALPAVTLAAIASVGAVLGATAVHDAGDTRWTAAAVVMVWAVAGALVAWRRPGEPLGTIMAVGAALGGVAMLADGRFVADGSGGWETVRTVATLFVPALGLHLALGLPDGRLTTRMRKGLTLTTYLVALATAIAARSADAEPAVPVMVISGFAVALGTAGYADRCRRAGPADRARLQWAGWGVVVATLVAVAGWASHALLEWPSSPGAVAVAATALVPVALALGSYEHLALRIDRILVETIIVSGLVLLVAGAYLLVVLGLGHAPDNDTERNLLGLSMVAAAVVAVFAGPMRSRLDESAHRRVYGERRSPDEALQTFGSRMSRAVPMDELLLQLAETLKTSMHLSAAEVWTGGEGVLELAVSVPDRGSKRLALSAAELPVVSRARVSGNAWLAVWVPSLLEGRDDRIVRVAPVAHSGELLGLIVVERAADAIAFVEEEERVLTELARQVGLALHNVRLDSALQASLEELQVRNRELQQSRLRIVTSADEARRTIERNLHDGAQQHLVALAVKIGLARQLAGSDPATAETLLDELRGDVQATLTELRALAHGIYPPLLRDRGIAEALRTAANRAPIPTEVQADDVGRHASEVEATVYFCCLEAIQNAGKYAGDGAHATVAVRASGDGLVFEIEDDGAGFDPAAVGESQGFVNMRDRLGAVGGSLEVHAAAGAGTRVRGVIPARPNSAA
ncbi:MAG: histidine kinase [Acidimicrobiia bacterium]